MKNRNRNVVLASVVAFLIYILIGWCEDVNKAWAGKDIVMTISGSYNDKYSVEGIRGTGTSIHAFMCLKNVCK